MMPIVLLLNSQEDQCQLFQHSLQSNFFDGIFFYWL
jgi:hypothetical protein